jgi:DNA topoisomerase II
MSSENEVNKYEKLTQREHILKRPDMYVGPNKSINESMWVYDEDNKIITKKNINFNPSFLKIVDEALVNCRDASVNDKTCDTIKIEYNMDEGFISIFNNGDEGIPIEIHPKYEIYVPQLIFGELNSSSNYDDDKKRIVGGKFGLGIKLTNIFSKKFIVEIDDNKRGKRYKQEWNNNMETVNKPDIKKLPAKAKSSIKITFYPDFDKLNIDNLDIDHKELFHRRAFDIVGCSDNKLKIYFNNNKIDINNFNSYIKLYYPDETIYYDDSNERWKVGIIYKPNNGNENISFVNGINTYMGGNHVNYVLDNILKTLINDYIKKKDKDIKITVNTLKDNIILFLNTVIENPSFGSQTKENLTSKISDFGSKYEMSETFIKKLSKCGIVEQMIQFNKFKESSNLKKTDGKKQIRIIGIPKLEDANKAGTKDSYKCSLILTEGDSAKATAMAGLTEVGRDYYGVFPLKGKILNVRDAPVSQLMNNEEINNLKVILGLKHNEDYSDETKFKSLRYGHIILLVDQDVDGYHIRGLFINMLHSLWPSLIKYPDFVQTLNTPIVKAFKNDKVKVFYNLSEFDEWKDSDDSKNWKTKYYKGLGTSTSIEAKEYFNNINDKLVKYIWKNENDDDTIKLAFDKLRTDDRKKWLMNYNKDNILTYENKNILYSEFINKELIHFSNEDLIRSIPNVIDGLKPSQRKILYGSFLRGLDKDTVKVSQLAGFVSDKSAYHHGEMSLNSAIIGMAQDFVGSNNINILVPDGQFGTRLKGGKDSASPRYIWTKLNELTTIIYNKIDDPILNYQYDDGMKIEPEYYAPIIPMILVNGTEGIGTGFSTEIPPYNPIEIINNLKRLLKKEKLNELDPWWQDFNGILEKTEKNKYEVRGNYTIENNKLIITELPIGVWTSNYKEFLEKMLEESNDKKIKKSIPLINYSDNNTDKKVNFVLEFKDDYLKNIDNDELEKTFKLISKVSLNNMHLYGPEGHIKKYDNVNDIILDYYKVRLNLYEKRKKYQLDLLKHELELINAKVKFILLIVNEEININNKNKSIIEKILENKKLPKLSKTFDDENKSYDYLLSMPIYNLTLEKIEELKKNLKDKTEEYNNLEEMTIEEIWLNELDILLNKYELWYNSKINNIIVKKTVKKNKKSTI